MDGLFFRRCVVEVPWSYDTAQSPRRKPTTSYLFTGKDADEHDLATINALGVNSFLSLSSVEPKLRNFEDNLFSEQAKETDCTRTGLQNWTRAWKGLRTVFDGTSNGKNSRVARKEV